MCIGILSVFDSICRTLEHLYAINSYYLLLPVYDIIIYKYNTCIL